MISDNEPGPRRWSGLVQFHAATQHGQYNARLQGADNLAKLIAQAVAREQKFFDCKIDQYGYGSIKIDTYVMTEGEYRDALDGAFRAGMAQAINSQPLSLSLTGVREPTTEDEAAAMAIAGTGWLAKHAPHRLTSEGLSLTLKRGPEVQS